MKKIRLLQIFALFVGLMISTMGWGQQSIINAGTATTQDFSGMGTSGTASLPTGFKIGTDWSSGTTATTQAYGTTGTGVVTGSSGGGTVNWANGVTGSSTERALGFLSSSGYTSPRSIIYAFTNNTGNTITSIDLAWNYEKYRSGSRAFDWTFFHGSTSTATTAETSGNQSYAADANNTTVSNPPLSISKSFSITGLSIANGSTYYLRWTYTGVGGSTNGQGLGIDDFSITLNAEASPPLITVNPSSLSGFTYLVGNGPSAVQSFTVEGSDLTDDITITPPTNYEISETSGSEFVSVPIILTQSSGSVAQTTIYVRLKAVLAVGTYNNEDITATSTNADNETVTCSGEVIEQIDWANLQWPANGNINLGGEFIVYAQVYEPGITNAAGQGAGITCWIGYSTANTDPSGWTNWVAATYNGDVGNNDEYKADIGAVITPAGTYYYASRFQLGSAPYVYGGYNTGGGGFWDGTNNVSGTLTINPPPQIDWCNLQSPENGNINVGGTFNVYARVYKAGLTEPAGQGAGISAWIGYNSSNTNPSTWENWIIASYNTDVGNNDEYMANIGSSLPAGTYYYASRFKYGLADYVYGGYSSGGGGFWDGTTYVSGVLNVTYAEPSNHVSNFTAIANSTSAITVSWTDSDASGYLIKGSDVGYGSITAPVDFMAESNGTLVRNVAAGSGSWQFTGLNPATTYYFKIWPYNGSGVTVNYKTDGTVPQATATTDAALYNVGDFGFTATSGNWGTTNANWKQWDGSGWNTTPSGAPTASDNVFILAGKTCIVEVSGKNCKNLTIENSGLLYTNLSTLGSSRFINVFGNITCNGTVGNGNTFDQVSFRIEGTSCLISGTGTFNAGRLSKNATTNEATTVTIDMNMNLRYGGTALFNNISNSIFNIILNEGQTLTLTGDGTNSGNIAVNGTSGSSGDRGGTVTINGTLVVSGIMYLTSNATTRPASVIIGSTGIINLNSVVCSASAAAGHSFTISNGGKLNFNGNTEDVWGSYSLTNNTYSFDAGSTVEYSYAGAQTIKNPANYSNLIVSGSDTKTLGENTIVNNNLNIQSGSVLSVSDKSLTVSGALTNNAGISGLVIKSDATGTGSLIHSTADVPATVERYLTKYNSVNDQMFHFLSSPVEAQSIQPEFVTDPPTAGHDFYSWDEVNFEWVNSKTLGGAWNPSFENNFVVGKGYLVAYPEDVTKNLTGELNTYPAGSPLVINCTHTVGKGAGWNLLGNPFPSALDWDAVILGDGMDNALYYYDNDNQNYRYYIQLPGEEGALGSGQRYIPAMQGFMVHAKSSGTKTVTINNSQRVHTGQNVYYKSAGNIPGSLSLKVNSNGFEDVAFVHFNSGATTQFDGSFDAYKLSGYNPQVPKIYTMSSDNQKLAINGLPDFTASFEIPVYFEAGAAGQQHLLADVSQIATTLYLADLKTNYTQNLTLTPEYTFTYEPGDDPNRFLLHFGTVGVPETPATARLHTYVDGIRLFVMNPTEGKAQVEVYNVQGQMVMHREIAAGLQSMTVKLAPGTYLVRMIGEQATQATKIVIQ